MKENIHKGREGEEIVARALRSGAPRLGVAKSRWEWDTI